jgi:hypothetical protein
MLENLKSGVRWKVALTSPGWEFGMRVTSPQKTTSVMKRNAGWTVEGNY